MQRNTTQPEHNRTTQQTADRHTTQRNATQPDDTTLSRLQHNATQRNTTGRTQHNKTPDRYATGGQAGRSTENSTEKFGQKTLQV